MEKELYIIKATMPKRAMAVHRCRCDTANAMSPQGSSIRQRKQGPYALRVDVYKPSFRASHPVNSISKVEVTPFSCFSAPSTYCARDFREGRVGRDFQHHLATWDLTTTGILNLDAIQSNTLTSQQQYSQVTILVSARRPSNAIFLSSVQQDAGTTHVALPSVTNPRE